MALLKRKRIGLNDAMSVVTRFVNACNRHDADGVAACLHPDFDSIQPMYPSRNFRGADQVRRNWQAIFDAEPGFRLTVLRSATADDTVWLELHGAGRDAEVAGIFIMGVVGDRVRWARIYSALVEPVAAGVGDATDPAASLQEVPPRHQSSAPGPGAVAEEDLIAPVLDMERSGRRRRRRRGSDDEGVATPDPAEAAAELDAADVEAAPEVNVADVLEVDAEPDAEVGAEPEVRVQLEVDGQPVAEVTGAAPADVVIVEEVGVEPQVAAIVVSEEADQPEPDIVVVTDVDEDAGPPTEAVEMVTLTDPDPEPEPEPEPQPEVRVDPAPQVAAAEPAMVESPGAEPPKRRFGKRSRP